MMNEIKWGCRLPTSRGIYKFSYSIHTFTYICTYILIYLYIYIIRYVYVQSLFSQNVESIFIIIGFAVYLLSKPDGCSDIFRGFSWITEISLERAMANHQRYDKIQLIFFGHHAVIYFRIPMLHTPTHPHTQMRAHTCTYTNTPARKKAQ